MTTHIFTEAIDLSEAILDPDNRVLRGAVLIRAGESANKRYYSEDVLQASVNVFEGVKAYADHPTRTSIKERAERSMRDITGWYANVRFQDGMILADRHFAKTAAGDDAWGIAEDISKGIAPKSLAGLSINAVGQATLRDDGGVNVESIEFAHSVDDVTTPAAGGTYIEGVQGSDLAQAFIEALDYNEWLTLRPDFRDRFEKEHRLVRRNARLSEVTEARDKYAARCAELEAELKSLQEARDTAITEAEQARRVVLVTETLASVKLPASWTDSLKTRLMEAPVDEWEQIIRNEQSKAKAAGHKSRVSVNVPPPSVARNPVVEVKQHLRPRDDETPAQYAARIAAAEQKRKPTWQ